MADRLVEEVRLVRECRLGRSEAFGPLVAHYQNAAYATARGFVRDHQDAQDIVQDSFIAAYCRLGQLREPAKFGSWLRAIVAMRCREWLRQRRRVMPLEHAEGEMARTARTAHERLEARQELWDGVEQLPEKLRAVVLLHYSSGWSHAEIARFLELPKSTVNGRLQQARQRLRETLSPAELEEMEMTRIDVREEVQEVVCRIATEPIEERIALGDAENIALYCGLDVDLEIRPGEGDELVLEGSKAAFGRSPEAARESLEKIEILNDRVEDFVETGPHAGEVFTGTHTNEDGNVTANSASTEELWKGYIRGEEYRMWGLKWETPFPFLEGTNSLPSETVEHLKNCARVTVVRQKMEDIILPGEAFTPELQKVFRPNSTNPDRVHGSIGFVRLVAHLPPGKIVDGPVEPLVVRFDELLPHLQAHQQPGLAAQVVGGEGQVDLPSAGGQHAGEVLHVEVGHPGEDGVGQFGMEVEVDEELLEAAHVPGGLEDVAVGHHQAGVGVGALGGDAFGEGVIREPVGGRPAAGVEFAGVADGGQRVEVDLVVGARSVADRFSADGPDVLARGQGRAAVRGGDRADVEERLEEGVDR